MKSNVCTHVMFDYYQFLSGMFCDIRVPTGFNRNVFSELSNIHSDEQANNRKHALNTTTLHGIS